MAVALQFCIPTTIPKQGTTKHENARKVVGPARRGRPMCLPSPLPPESEWLRWGDLFHSNIG